MAIKSLNMWKLVKILFVNKMISSTRDALSQAKLGRAIFSFFVILALMVYVSRKFDANRYLLKTFKSQKAQKISININSATVQELDNLPQVGRQTAERIMAYRLEHDGFKDLRELERVKGIGPKKLIAMQKYITI